MLLGREVAQNLDAALDAVEAVRVLRDGVCHKICHNARTAAKTSSRKCLIEMVGTPRFELGASPTPRVRATRLRHVPSPS